MALLARAAGNVRILLGGDRAALQRRGPLLVGGRCREVGTLESRRSGAQCGCKAVDGVPGAAGLHGVDKRGALGMTRWTCGKPEWAEDDFCPLETEEVESCDECPWGVEEEEYW